jgi:predicted Zn finger-like uncharacterized protein
VSRSTRGNPNRPFVRFYPTMADSSLRPHTTAAVADVEPGPVSYATCPMCHTPASVTESAIEAGGDWRCTRCGQHWDATRLAAVAAYATWVVERDRASGRETQSSHDGALHHDSSTERPDGTP